METTEPKPEYEKIVKDPYVMEFLQIQPDNRIADRMMGLFRILVDLQIMIQFCSLLAYG